MSSPEPELEDFGKFLEIFNKESDRGAVLIAASMMDDVLMKLLQSFFLDAPEVQQLLSGFNAPLGTLHSRLLAAYGLGVIEEDEFRDASIIRRIRNEFGHTWQGATFETGRVADLCKQLGWRGPGDVEVTSRGRFNFSIGALLMDWLWRARLVSREKRSLRNWPNKGGPPRLNM